MTSIPTTIGAQEASEGAAKRVRRGRRGNHEGTIIRRRDGRWAAAVTVGPGRRRWLYGRTRADVSRRLTQALKATQDGTPIPVETETVGGFLEGWLRDTVANRVRPATHASYACIVRLHIVPELGQVRLARLTPAQVQSLLNRKLASGLSPRRVEYTRSVLRQALGHALRWNLVARNVAALTDRPRPVRREIQPLTAEQARVFLRSVRGHRLEALFALALSLGLRQGELLGLRWADVELDQGFIHVRRSLQRLNGAFALGELKTAQSQRRLGALPAGLLETMRVHRLRQTQERLASEAWEDWDLVFTGISGHPLHASSVTHEFQDLLREAGLPPQRFHDLRHACASLLMAQGVNPRVVMQILGHSQITLTLQTYSHVAPSTQHAALTGLSASLSERL